MSVSAIRTAMSASSAVVVGLPITGLILIVPRNLTGRVFVSGVPTVRWREKSFGLLQDGSSQPPPWMSDGYLHGL
jgi:hypothetical protein